MYVCKLCNKKLNNSWSFLTHLKWDHHASEESLEGFIELKSDKILIAVLEKENDTTETIEKNTDKKIEENTEERVEKSYDKDE